MSQPDRWLVLTARSPRDPTARELLGEALLALGGRSVLDEGDALTTYLPPPPDAVAFQSHAQRVLAEALIHAEPLELT